MLKLYITLIRRELWENRSMIGVPLAIMLMQFIIGLIKSNQLKQILRSATQESSDALQQAGVSITVDTGEFITNLIQNYTETQWHQLILHANISLFSVMLSIITVLFYFYCIYSLNREYQDRSFLFWKSLPISDAGIIFSKVLTILTTIIGLAFLISFTLLVQMSIEIAMLIPTDLKAQFFRGLLSASLKLTTLNLVSSIYLFLVALPYFSWALLVSAWTRSSPFVHAIVYPLIGASIISITMGQDLIPNFFAPFKAIAEPFHAGLFETSDVFGSVIAHFMQLFLQPNLGIGLGVGLLFIALTVIVRMRKDV